MSDDANETLTISKSSENFEYWINQPFVDSSIKAVLQSASVLIVPTVGFRIENQASFPVNTEVLLNYLRERMPSELGVDICINDEQYLELALHSNFRRIGRIVLTQAALPVFLAVLSSYVYDNFVKPKESSQPQTTLVDNSKHFTIINNIQPQQSLHEPSTYTPHKSKESHEKQLSIRKHASIKKEYMKPPQIKVSIVVVQDSTGKATEFSYEGSAENFDKVINAIKDSTSVVQ